MNTDPEGDSDEPVGTAPMEEEVEGEKVVSAYKTLKTAFKPLDSFSKPLDSFAKPLKLSKTNLIRFISILLFIQK
jgi:hypothetical protein